MENQIISVSDAIALVNQTLDYAFPKLVIEGEVASFKINQEKFVFFDIKDDTGTLGCFMMKYQLRTALEDGMRVQVTAVPKLTAWGKFSLTVSDIKPVGEGSLKRAFEILKKQLNDEGLFSVDRKRALPLIPEYVAVISSTQSAGYADFVRILGERWGGLRVDVAHVQVQGAEAPDQIIRAIRHFNSQEELPEIIVIIRGGGSADDLSAFNDELLVREIASSRVPTIVGVGHETDESLADKVADVRASTPSHVAQIIVPNKSNIIRASKGEVVRVADVINSAISGAISDVAIALETALEASVARCERSLETLEASKKILEAYNPLSVLARGYAIVRGEISTGSIIEIEKQRQFITAEVKDVREK